MSTPIMKLCSMLLVVGYMYKNENQQLFLQTNIEEWYSLVHLLDKDWKMHQSNTESSYRYIKSVVKHPERGMKVDRQNTGSTPAILWGRAGRTSSLSSPHTWLYPLQTAGTVIACTHARTSVSCASGKTATSSVRRVRRARSVFHGRLQIYGVFVPNR